MQLNSHGIDGFLLLNVVINFAFWMGSGSYEYHNLKGRHLTLELPEIYKEFKCCHVIFIFEASF